MGVSNLHRFVYLASYRVPARLGEHTDSSRLPEHLLLEAIPQSTIVNETKGQRWKLCPKCRAKCIAVHSYLCKQCEVNVTLNLVSEIPDGDNKLCQHCIERGYDNPRPASKRWLNGHYTCDDCYTRLSAAITDIPSHFTDYLLQSDDILKHRDEFFNHHHAAIVNLPNEEILERLEHYKRILFTVRICAEDCQSLIDKAKREAKAKLGLSDSKFDATKDSDKTAGAKLKLTKEQKLKAGMAKTLGISVAQLEMLGKTAQTSELATMTGTTVCEKCSKINCICGAKPETSVLNAEKSCPYCAMKVPSLIKHYMDCTKRPRKV